MTTPDPQDRIETDPAADLEDLVDLPDDPDAPVIPGDDLTEIPLEADPADVRDQAADAGPGNDEPR